MSIFVDIALIAIIIWKTVRGYMKGLTGIVLGFASLIISFISALLLGPAIADGSAGIIMYVVVFAVTYIICTVVTHLLTKIKIPVAHTIDKILGTVLGLVVGVIMVAIVAVMIYGILFVLDMATGNEMFMDIYNNSTVFKFIYEFNIFGFVKDMLI